MNFISVDTPYEQIHKHFWTHFSKKFSLLCERFLVILALCAPVSPRYERQSRHLFSTYLEVSFLSEFSKSVVCRQVRPK